MGLITANRAVIKEPRVSVTRPKSAQQVRIAFNASLVQKTGLATQGHVAIDHDEINRRLRFIPCGATYRGTQAHKLLLDGGKATVARMVSVAGSALPFLPTGTYEPQMVRGNKTFDIAYGTK